MEDDVRLSERRLDWPACYNTRDLGGLATRGGGFTRLGAVVRSDYLTRLTTEGWQALVAYGIRTIIDLRSTAELQDSYTLPLDAIEAGVRYHLLTLVPPDADGRTRADVADTLDEAYVAIVDGYGEAVATVLRGIATAPPGGVLVHCQAGRDRTAIIMALLLALAGVSHETIAADYVASQTCLWRLWEEQVEQAGSEEAAGLHLRPLLETQTMLHLLSHLKVRYGGAEGYMAHIGLEAVDQEALLARLREP